MLDGLTVPDAGVLRTANTTLERDGQTEKFAPHRMHKPHAPFPIAIVNRKPHGLPGHNDIRVPQDAAWLGAFRFAKRSVFVQTPTFNAKPAVHAALQACRRGVHVTVRRTELSVADDAQIWSDFGFSESARCPILL